MPLRVRSIVLLLAAVLTAITAVSLVYFANIGVGSIEGRVSIGPWTPVEPPGGNHPPPEVYTSRHIVLEGTLLPRVEIPMNGTGYFRADVKAGTYTLTMTNCTFLGCSRIFPMTVIVKPGQTTALEIDIDTGIR